MGSNSRLITRQDLPLDEKKFFELVEFFNRTKDSELHVAYPSLPTILLQDDCDQKTWRLELEGSCCTVVGRCLWHYGQSLKEFDEILAIILCPGSLPFIPSLDKMEIRKIMVDTRAICNPSVPRFPDENDKKLLRRKLEPNSQVWLMDSAIDLGDNVIPVIWELTENFGLPEEQIVVLSVSATRPGVYNIFSSFPKIRILSHSLSLYRDEGVSADGFGNVGYRYLYKNTLLDELKKKLTESQLEYLLNLIQEVSTLKS